MAVVEQWAVFVKAALVVVGAEVVRFLVCCRQVGRTECTGAQER